MVSSQRAKNNMLGVSLIEKKKLDKNITYED